MKRKKVRDPFGGKRDPATQLLRAAKRYIEWKHGTVLVIGGIDVEQWPDAGKFKYKLAVGCLGRLPHKDGSPKDCQRCNPKRTAVSEEASR